MRASTRGPGWQRASRGNFNPEPHRVIEARASAVSLGNQGRTDLSLGQRVFHGKFGYGTIEEIEGNKLEIELRKLAERRSSTVRQRDLIPPEFLGFVPFNASPRIG